MITYIHTYVPNYCPIPVPWPKTVSATNAIIIIIKETSSSAHDKSLGLGGLRKTICITVQTDLLLIKSFSSRSSFTTTTTTLSATQHQFRPCCAGPQCLISFVPEYAGRPQHWNRLLGDSQSLHGYIPFINCRFIFLRQHRIIRVIRGLPGSIQACTSHVLFQWIPHYPFRNTQTTHLMYPPLSRPWGALPLLSRPVPSYSILHHLSSSSGGNYYPSQGVVVG